MDGGASWSGSERNNAFLNLGDGTFADASAVLGIDFMDDARAVVTTDWDGDGDLDVISSSDTGGRCSISNRNSSVSVPYIVARPVTRTGGGRGSGPTFRCHSWAKPAAVRRCQRPLPTAEIKRRR